MRNLPIIETERLVIRPFKMEDQEDLTFLFSGMGSSAEEEAASRKRWLRWSVLNYEFLARLYLPPYGDRAVCLKDGKIVGAVGVVPYLDRFDRLPYFGGRENAGAHTEVGLFWTIAPEHRRRGYATEAARGLVEWLFRHERLKRVIAATGQENQASRAVMLKLGMHVEENPAEDPGELPVVGVLENRQL